MLCFQTLKIGTILFVHRQIRNQDITVKDITMNSLHIKDFNLFNNFRLDNQYGKMVNQKANYLLGQPFVIETNNDRYGELLKHHCFFHHLFQ